MNTTQEAVRQKTEACLAAYVRNYFDPNTGVTDFNQSKLDVICRREGSPLNGLPIYEGETPAQFSIPCIIINCPSSKRMTADKDTPWSIVNVEAHVLSHVEENNEGSEEDEAEEGQTDALNFAAQLHAERVGALTTLLDDTDAVKTAANLPVGEDARPVKEYAIFDLWNEGEQSNQYDLHWDHMTQYEVACTPLDPSED